MGWLADRRAERERRRQEERRARSEVESDAWHAGSEPVGYEVRPRSDGTWYGYTIDRRDFPGLLRSVEAKTREKCEQKAARLLEWERERWRSEGRERVSRRVYE